jgi:hypothetical protein
LSLSCKKEVSAANRELIVILRSVQMAWKTADSAAYDARLRHDSLGALSFTTRVPQVRGIARRQ